LGYLGGKMEYWDLYNKDKQKINKIILRGERINDGEYFLVVNIWIINNKNELIITQRHPENSWPLKWECTGGAILAGEDSYTGALREVEEEIGIKLKTKGELIDTLVRKDSIKDVYVFRENIEIEETKLEEGAVVDIKWVTLDELNEMVKNNEIAEPIIYDIEKLKEYYGNNKQ
jgi:8-oxo-dGTP pyrophosphatase MutT (NUDIX family)